MHLVTPRPGGEPTVPVDVHRLPAAGGRPSARSGSARLSAATRRSPPCWTRCPRTWSTSATRCGAYRHRVGRPRGLRRARGERPAGGRAGPLPRARRRRPGRRGQPCGVSGAASAVVCVSDAVADWALHRQPATGPGPHVPNGVDAERIRPAAAPVTPATGADFTVGFVGTLKPWHGVGDAGRGIRPAGRSAATWRLLVVGDGPLRSAPGRSGGAVGSVRRRSSSPGRCPGRGVGAAAADGRRLRAVRSRAVPPTSPRSRSMSTWPPACRWWRAPSVNCRTALDHGDLGRLVPAGDVAALAGGLACGPRGRRLADELQPGAGGRGHPAQLGRGRGAVPGACPQRVVRTA